jgi:phosphate transport system protein
MREVFHGELEQLGDELANMCGLVCSAMERATRALLDTDLELAEEVITADDEINRQNQRCEQHACTQLALQAPVAKDLRIVVTAIKASEKIARMGDLARHIAEIARLRHPNPAVPAELSEQFARMGSLALQACRHVERTIAAPDGVHLPALQRVDDGLDQLHREVLDAIVATNTPYPVQVGVDVALLARYFERFADQAVSITRQLDYVVTGDMYHRPGA